MPKIKDRGEIKNKVCCLDKPNLRTAKAGKQMAEAILEFVNLMYLNDNAIQVLHWLIKILNYRLNVRKVKWIIDGNKIIE